MLSNYYNNSVIIIIKLRKEFLLTLWKIKLYKFFF